MLNSEEHATLQIVWTSTLEIGHPEIDAEHHAMVKLLNYVQAASHRSDESEVRSALRTLEALTRDHFAHEERLMRDIGYEMAARHQEEHIHLFDEIRAQIEDLNDGITSAVAIAQFIRRWLMNHVETSDRQLALALARRHSGSPDRLRSGTARE